MADPHLTPEQEQAAERMAAIIREKTQAEALAMARLLVSKKDHELLGAPAFALRDRAHKIAACVIETAGNQRKTGGTQGRA